MLPAAGAVFLPIIKPELWVRRDGLPMLLKAPQARVVSGKAA